MPSWIGLPEILILLVIVLLIFGPKKLPELGRSLGRGMREFKDSITGKDDDDDKQIEERHVEQAAPVAPVTTTATTADEEARARAAGPADAS
ncbi:MAG: sec-independent protein translocase protein TatA [Thermoleophilaceae bacterium]|jgi:sec-independent protein translocase protein TatA|nr:sec-independent protein translocase protein TatA [Thermoleophilaceae bacterium]MEA2352520.1 sec-independent protein translocase protein TatA [Thermoleophilaceae bacterium]